MVHKSMVHAFVIVVTFVTNVNTSEIDTISELVKQWAPLVWLAPGEKYMPLGVEQFLNNMFVSEDGTMPIQSEENSHFFPTASPKQLFLVTKDNLDALKENTSSFLHGANPKEMSVPMYAVVHHCTPYKTVHTSDTSTIKNDINLVPENEDTSLYFHVSYWAFYPYNEGKDICFIGKVPSPTLFGRCLGHLKTMGNHVGDWEHITLSFQGKPFPNEMYMAVHDAGVYYKYVPEKKLFQYFSQITTKGLVQIPKFPPIVRITGGHPVLFSALGSHGFWSAPGDHYYVRVPRLYDKNGYGVPWKTWKNLNVFHVDVSILPDWMQYRGKWGNPKSNCLLFKKLGICENSDGPTGILMRKPDFYCLKVI